MINILFIGDICGKLGREAVKKSIPLLKEKYAIDFIVANGENTTHGRGLSYSHYKELMDYGINCITMGNHFFGVEEIIRSNEKYTNLIRPLNLPEKIPGTGTKVFTVKGKTVQITNLLGVSEINFMGQNNPFTCIDNLLSTNKSDIHIIDFHAEATGEKGALARFVDGKVSAVIGTHTHVQTNDARILPLGTGLLSDVGACCAYNSILGMNSDEVISRNAYGIPKRFFTPSTGPKQFNAVILMFNDEMKLTEFKLISDISQ